jgi:hypothetical protein
MKSFKLLSMLVAGAVALSATAAFAQRDAGAKMRGEFGTGFWSAPGLTRTYTYRVPAYVAPAPIVVRAAPAVPAAPAAPQVAQAPTARRAFSVEPGAAVTCPSAPTTTPATAQRAPAVRRSYSYEPTYAPYVAPQWMGRRAAPQPTYLLPRTDPRKHGG